MTGVVILNRGSGPEETTTEELRRHFPGHLVVECKGDTLSREVRKALDEGARFVAVAGGDGSIRCAASLLAGTNTPLVPVPAGTRNHFARQLGIATVDDAVAALDGERRAVDVAEVNGERFVNNSSIGFYAALVRERSQHERRLPRALANLTAAWAQARRGRRFPVWVGDRRYRAWLVFVGNGGYGESITDMMNRRALDEGVLDLRVLRADAPLARTRAVLALLLGRPGRSRLVVCEEAQELEVRLEGGEAEVALDGEVMRLHPPLRYRSLPKALIVLIPANAAANVVPGSGR